MIQHRDQNYYDRQLFYDNDCCQNCRFCQVHYDTARSYEVYECFNPRHIDDESRRYRYHIDNRATSIEVNPGECCQYFERTHGPYVPSDHRVDIIDIIDSRISVKLSNLVISGLTVDVSAISSTVMSAVNKELADISAKLSCNCKDVSAAIISTLELSVNNINASINKLSAAEDAKIADLNAQMIAANLAQDSKIAALSVDVASLSGQISGIDELRADAKQMSSDIKQTSTDVKQISAQISGFNKQIAELSAQTSSIPQMKTDIDNLKTTQAEQDDKIAKNIDDISVLNLSVQNFNLSIESTIEKKVEEAIKDSKTLSAMIDASVSTHLSAKNDYTTNLILNGGDSDADGIQYNNDIGAKDVNSANDLIIGG